MSCPASREQAVAPDLGSGRAPEADARTGGVAVVIPAYNEPADALGATVTAIRDQTMPISRIIVVDDCSPQPVSLGRELDPRIGIMRLPSNSGISGARNAGADGLVADYVAFVNVDVLPREDWFETCVAYLDRHPKVGVVSTRTRPMDEASLLGRWRLLVQERPYANVTGPVPWVAGHAMLLRAAAFAAVGGFDVRMQRAGEDVDICHRLVAAGWEVHHVHETECRSIQEDSVPALANAEYNRFCWRSTAGNGFLRCAGILTGRMMVRCLLHVLRRRWAFLPVEFAVWATGLRISWLKR